MWTISIHDMVYLTRWKIINGAAHHTLHHLEFYKNYGQYFTFWDRVCGTHKAPSEDQMNGKYRDKLK
jgi:lathosterol oxidase